ncbi:SDR family oxidoreductase [Schumannella sp. 10F1B-5-1]|uniref:SDR family oxidoreductase n=1 Tax=Schumannella sp. 10F1B-5-1 TaxID=2590780 RepID=UPI0011305EF0|nr:NAD(P)H-binding protein [Schumannella sp. 10F1B-5-1]TPW76942.1 NAD-dependent epimerase/dehydratase family protein [Schumannella sp. 10F1B-5-1]
MKIAIAGATGVVGRHTVSAAEAAGHEVVALSRSAGHDILDATATAAALEGVDALVDVTSVGTIKARESVAFFEPASRALLQAERLAGVTHHVALSIVGIDDIDDGYYAGKLAQERIVTSESGAVPWTILRATQFHEFAEQTLVSGRIGPLNLVPKATVRTVAAREVGARLIELAAAPAVGRARDLVGPEPGVLVEQMRRMLRHDGVPRRLFEVRLPGAFGRGMASGALAGTDDADRAALTFDAWLDSVDHTSVS